MPAKISSKENTAPGSAPADLITAAASNDGSDHHEEVARAAYFHWEARGCPEGSPEEDWFRAKQGLNGQTPA